MSAQVITDSNGSPLVYINLRLDEGAQSVVIVGNVPCSAGMFLTAAADARAQVLARPSGSVDAFIDIAVASVALAPWDGQTIAFDFKVAALSVAAGIERVALPVRVTYNP